tara:strand:+ start:2629 stop:3900 length:1272 start_codon:yes stop_codon:yes gene_type:complete
MVIQISRIAFLLLIVTYKALLDMSYLDFIVPVFSYSGFQYIENSVKYFESWVLFSLAAIFVPHRLCKPSDFLFFIFFVLTITPMLSMYGLSNQPRVYMYFCMLIFIIFTLVRATPSLRVPYIKNGNQVAIIISGAFVALSVFKFIVTGAIWNINFDLAKVYEHREQLGDTLGSGLWGYIIPWTSKIFTLVILSIFLYNKKYLLALLVVMFQVLLFGITSHKGVALYPIFAIALFMLKDVKYILTYCLLSLVVLLISCYLAYFIWNYEILASLFTRRVFFLPSLLNFHYYDFFSKNGHLYLGHGILSPFVEYIYDIDPKRLIGSTYFGAPDMAANTGFIATSYMNFGFLGMIVFGFIAAAILKLVDGFSEGGKPSWFYISFISAPYFSLLTSSELLTSLLTHGLLASLLLAWLTYNRSPQGTSR